MGEVIKLENVSKSFKNNILFRNVNISIKKGEIIGLFGHNGSGKSVLFKLISGIYRCDEGEIFIRGKKIGKEIDFPADIGISIDSPGFIEIYSGFNNLRYLADIKNIISNKEIEETMLKVGLDPYNKTIVKNYSLGMKQKLALAQAIMENQDIIILDEPFNGLDTESYNRLINIINELREDGKTVLLTSHNNNDMYNLCDRIYQIDTFNIIELQKSISI